MFGAEKVWVPVYMIETTMPDLMDLQAMSPFRVVSISEGARHITLFGIPMKFDPKIVLLVLLSILTSVVKGQEQQDFFTKADVFFDTYVKAGKVDYRSLKSHPQELEGLLLLAKKISISKNNASVFQAFWINTYNLLVIKGVVDHYPLNSPLDVDGFFDKIAYEVGGMNITLNELEHQLLRENFPDEPRFHFVLVCAGLGCPPIIDKAYLPTSLEAQLEAQTSKAMNDPNFIRTTDDRIMVSQIFEWYAADFSRNGNGLIGFINRYRDPDLSAEAKIGFYPYDWKLNDIKH